MNDRYKPLEIEAKWQETWQDEQIYKVDLNQEDFKSKFYAFAMFAYPSGAGIHVGHVKNFTISDVLLRFNRQRGDLVYAPVGFDAFGLPAENYALKTGTSPQETTTKAITNFSKQYKACGFSFDWSKVINTSEAEYYRWTQWCFLQLYKDKMAYQKESSQWWCSQCQTVLADEQIIDGKCWRHDSEEDGLVSRSKVLKQWFFKITDYADEILQATDSLDWTNWVKVAQANYIGKSQGVIIEFALKGLDLKEKRLEVFTTALDTIYGATFMVLAPEHSLVEEILTLAENKQQLQAYILQAQTKNEVARQQAKTKTGVEVIGLKAINPLTKMEMSVYIADYVLASYGAGAIMAVPGADERDLEFATKYDLPVIYPTQTEQFVAYKEIRQNPEKYHLATRDKLNGLSMREAKMAIFKKLKALKVVQKKTNFKLRDWLISRQRYWGAPIPIIYCKKCGTVPVKEEDLPVKLPVIDDYQPSDGRSPLAKIKDFVEVECPNCGADATRETDTMDTYVCSSWYQMRYLAANDEHQAWDSEMATKWLPVDFYNGGDHATAHLLYARFLTRFFYKKGLVPTPEPFTKMYFHAKILAPDGKSAFSKSKGNIIDPLSIIKQGYGADALRVYICSVAPPDVETVWSHNGVPGAYRFLQRIWTLVDNYLKNKPVTITKTQDNLELLQATHQCIFKNNQDIKRLKFNTALAAQMELVNTFYKISADDNFANPVWQFCLEAQTMILAPFAPHLASELWRQLGHLDDVHLKRWPKVDPQYLILKTIIIPIQVNGKLRAQIEIEAQASPEEVITAAKEVEAVAKYLRAAEIKKEIYVPQKIVNFVV